MIIESIALVGLTLDKESRERVEKFDSAKLFADDPAALNALIAMGLTDAAKAAASNPAGAGVGFAGVGMAGNFGAAPAPTYAPVASAPAPAPTYSTAPAPTYAPAPSAPAPAPAFTGPEFCPFCGTPLPNRRLDNCPACIADIRSYYS